MERGRGRGGGHRGNCCSLFESPLATPNAGEEHRRQTEGDKEGKGDPWALNIGVQHGDDVFLVHRRRFCRVRKMSESEMVREGLHHTPSRNPTLEIIIKCFEAFTGGKKSNRTF